MEHFLMKSACIVSTSSAMLASVLSKAGITVLDGKILAQDMLEK